MITYDTLELRGDHVLIKRIERATTSGLVLPDAKPKSIEGEVIQVGPGKYVPGEWWYFKMFQYYGLCECEGRCDCGDEGWKWITGEVQPMSLKIGDKVLFNSKWDDFNHHELRAIGADRNSKTAPLENPRPWWHDQQYHLVTERDVFGVLSKA